VFSFLEAGTQKTKNRSWKSEEYSLKLLCTSGLWDTIFWAMACSSKRFSSVDADLTDRLLKTQLWSISKFTRHRKYFMKSNHCLLLWRKTRLKFQQQFWKSWRVWKLEKAFSVWSSQHSWSTTIPNFWKSIRLTRTKYFKLTSICYSCIKLQTCTKMAALYLERWKQETQDQALRHFTIAWCQCSLKSSMMTR